MDINRKGMPIIRRARSYYLYDAQRQRWLDFWLDDGQAFFGHKPQRLALHLKKTIDRGLYARYPSYESRRLLKKLTFLEEGFLSVARYRYASEPEKVEPFTKHPTVLKKWRPGWHDYKHCQLLEVQLPLSGFHSPRFLLMREEKSKTELEQLLRVKLEEETNFISPLVANGLLQVLHYNQTAVQKNSSEQLQWFDSQPWWQRWGCYLHFRAASSLYTSFWQTMAQKRLFFPPSAEQLAIVPPLINTNDWEKLLKAGESFQKEKL